MAKTRRLTIKQLDEIANPDGFKFKKRLSGLPRVLYTNGRLNRVYNSSTGKVVTEYQPKIDEKAEFNHPVAYLPAILTEYGFG